MPLKIIHTKNLRWVDIVSPDDKDLNYLKENFKFHPLDFDDITTPSIRTKIDEYDHYLFIVLLFPYYDSGSNEIRSTEVDFFVGPDYVVTVHAGKMKTLNNLVHNAHQYDHSRVSTMSQGPGFLLFMLLAALLKRSSPILDKINQQMVESERDVFELGIATLRKLAELKKNIIVYRRIVKMHRYVLSKLLHSGKEYLKFNESKTAFQDLIEYGENIWNVLSSDKEGVDSFEETNQSLAGHKMNDILRILTVFSVIIFMLTLFINILLFVESISKIDTWPFLLPATLAMLCMITISMLFYFTKRKWL